MAIPTINFIVHPEEIPIEGNALVSGDEAENQKEEQRIRDQLNSCNGWAWCCVEVQAELGGFTGRAFLGCVSCDSEQDFKQSGGYYQQMVQEACDDLRQQIRSAHEAQPARAAELARLAALTIEAPES